METLKRILVAMIASALTSALAMLAGTVLLRAINPFGAVQEFRSENIPVLAFLIFLSGFFGAVIGLVIAAFKFKILAGIITGILVKGFLGVLIFLILVSSTAQLDYNARYVFPLVLALVYAFYGGVTGIVGAYTNQRFLATQTRKIQKPAGF